MKRGKNWRVVFKALSLLEHLIKNGAERCVDEARERIYTIRTLTEFRYNENGSEKGTGVREKAKQLVTLLNDTKQIREARKRARELRDKFVGISSHQARFDGPRGRGGDSRNRNKGSGSTFDRRDDFGGFGNEGGSYSSGGFHGSASKKKNVTFPETRIKTASATIHQNDLQTVVKTKKTAAVGVGVVDNKRSSQNRIPKVSLNRIAIQIRVVIPKVTQIAILRRNEAIANKNQHRQKRSRSS